MVTPATVARLPREVLRAAGVSDKFTAHSNQDISVSLVIRGSQYTHTHKYCELYSSFAVSFFCLFVGGCAATMLGD